MSRDIRSFFKVLSTSKPQSKSTSSSTTTKNKRPVIVDSSDEDVISETPEPKKSKLDTKKRKHEKLSSDSENEQNKLAKKKTDKIKNETIPLKPVDVSSTFSSTPVKRTPVPEKLEKKKTPEDEQKNLKVKKKGKIKSKPLNTELGVHDDKKFEQSLLDLDEDFLIANVDELDKSINNALKTAEDKDIKSNGKIDTDSPKVSRSKKVDEHCDGDPDQERYERKRQSAILYQKYLNRSGPAHHGSKELPKGTPDCLKNLCFVRTGVLDSLEKEEFETLIKDHGGRVVQTVSKKVNYMVVGEDPGPAKLEKAKNIGIKCISEDELLELIREKSGLQSHKVDSPAIDDLIEGLTEKVVDDTKPVVKTVPTSLRSKIEKNSNKNNDGNKKSKPESSTSLKDECKISNKEILDDSKSSKQPMKQENITQDKAKLPQISDELKDSNLPWTEKYKPKSIKSIIGQQTDKSIMNRLMIWLKNWYKNNGSKNKPKLTKPSPWAKNDDGGFFKAALLSGPPGIGKTTTATLVTKELGFDVVEFNASDTRNKKLLHEEVSQLLSTKSLAGYFTDGSAPTNKHVLLMDEVDGMAGNEDRGGVQELISLIKNSNVPIICMCNDRNHPKIRSLSNYCFDLRLSRPRMEQIKGAMMSVCYKEGVKISPDVLSEIITSAGMDIRQVLTHLSLWSTEKKTTNEDMKAPKKDSPLGPWEVCRKVFSAEDHKTSTIGDQEKLFYYDYSIGPLFIHENYLRVLPHAPKNEHLQRFSAAANSISLGDLVDTKIRRSNNWSLLNIEAMCSSVLPGSYLSGHVNGQIDFPNWLGKNSKRNKFVRLLGELQAHMRTSISGNRNELNLDYISSLRMSLVNPLIMNGADGVTDSINVMHNYHLLREDLDSILELAQWPKQKDPMNMVDSKIKAAFTRSYNKINAKLPYAVQTGVSKKRTAVHNDEYDLSEEEGDPEEVEEDKDITKDGMIKAKKASTKPTKKDEPSSSGNKRAAKGTGSRAAKKMKK